jgi:formylglycine-generating enzyme required for sulfatase activity/dienelactone hydrolase
LNFFPFMASIIPGYEYDIFISYRQKDNKYDGWVTEFVDNLKMELEATFKEEVSVYFDINPHDGLQESHDVAASLKQKLRSLICIPIISLTYCDPKSYAWEYEFKTFIEQASHDRFGLKINLPGGNVANRVLPVRIHDLYPEDVRLFESTLGGVLRPIDFVYRETGVNRQLRPKDDDVIKNPNQILYRDQINKVAHAIRDIIEGIKSVEYRRQDQEEEVNQEKSPKVAEPVYGQKSAPERHEERSENEKAEIRYDRVTNPRLPWKPGRLLTWAVISILIFAGMIFLIQLNSRKAWARNVALPEIEKYVNNGDVASAYILVKKAGKYIPGDPKLGELSALASSKITIITDPPGAEVYIREYADTAGDWEKLGRTPIDSVQVPGSSFWLTNMSYRTRIEKPGYEKVLAVMSTTDNTLRRKLFREGEIPPGMVYIDGDNGFFVDRYEVTNKQFKEFLDKGGYDNPDYWKNDFIKDGKTISRETAMALFVDKTGRPGPSTWEAGDYPEGQENYPVSGVSWYEAAAYAEFAGKNLPTANDWGNSSKWFYKSDSRIIPFSNFNRKGPEQVGRNKGITMFGVYDMAGNVREWCWNKTPVGRIVRGGAWDDVLYMYKDLSQLPPLDRSSTNGFRCVKYIDRSKIPESDFGEIISDKEKDLVLVNYAKKAPVPDNIFKIYKNQFLYDSKDLQAVVEKQEESPRGWKVDKVSFNAAYGDERVIAYIFLPEDVSPPFQTLVFYPGTGAFWERDMVGSAETNWLVDYLVKSGHAVMCPVYAGTFERNDKGGIADPQGHEYVEWIIKWVKDFKRSVDYLETRNDIDKNKIGYYGFSWGGLMGGIIPAVEDRLKVNILIVGGFARNLLPEVDQVNYLSRIKIPTLMLNGRYDFNFPYDKAVIPFFNLLGTPDKDKRHVVYETDHYVPKNEMIKEVLNWCDKYLGPVK